MLDVGAGKAVWVTAACSAIAICLLAPAATAAPSAAATAVATGVPTAIAVHQCPTSLALPPRPQLHLPVKVNLDVPAQYVGKLSVFGDKLGTRLLAPRGWSCEAQYGADGMGGMSLSPPGSSPSPNSEQVDATTTGGCGACAGEVACDMFKSAAAAFSPVIPGGKCPTRPAGETVVHLTPNIVAFEIPPHGKGAGNYPENGVLTYYPNPRSVPLTWTGECILPQSERRLCTAVLNQFIIWDGGPRGPI